MVTKIVSGNDPRALPCQLDASFTFEDLAFFYSESFHITPKSGAKPSDRATGSKDGRTVWLGGDASKLPQGPPGEQHVVTNPLHLREVFWRREKKRN